jgi:2-octaprenyl-6-methoxyphenol hydroxylase
MARHKKSISTPANERLFDAVIAGGGMAGLCMAAHLGSSGLHVCVVEKESADRLASPSFDGRTTAIASGSVSILEACGVWEELKPHGSPINDIHVADQQSAASLDFESKKTGEGPFGFIIENSIIRTALFARIKSLPNVTLKCPASITATETGDDQISVTLDNGEMLAAKLLIAADGRNSFCRQQAGIRNRSWSYNQSALVCTIKHSKPHNGLALEHFHPGGPFAILPMTENRSSIVWTERPETAETLKDLTEDEFCTLLKERGGDYLGTVSLASSRMLWPLTFMLADRLMAPRLALIGEAAHAMHPIAGQGFNLSLRDISVLGDLCAAQREDIGDEGLLKSFERKRQLDHFTFLAATDLLEKLFSNNIVPLRMLRRFGLGLVERLPPAKNFFSRMAMGLLNR